MQTSHTRSSEDQDSATHAQLNDQEDQNKSASTSEWPTLTTYNMGLTCLVAGLVWWMIHPFTETGMLLIWSTAICGVSALRLLYATFLNIGSLPIKLMRFYTPGFYTLAAISGVIWASVLFLVTPGEMLAVDAFLVMVLFAVNVVAYASYIRTPTVQLILGTPIYVLIWIWTGMGSGFFHTAINLSIPILLIANWYLVKYQSRRLVSPNQEKLRMSLMQREINLTKGSLSYEVEERLAVESDLKRTHRLFLDGPAVAYRFKINNMQREVLMLSGNVQQYGHNAHALTGKLWENLVHPDDLDVISLECLSGYDDRTSPLCQREYRFRRADGSYRWIYDYIVPVRDENDKFVYLDGYFIDVTKLHNIGDALSKEKERAQVTLQSIGDAVITTDTHGLVQFSNQEAERLTGWHSSEANHVSINEVLSIRRDEKTAWINDPLKFYYGLQDEDSNEHITVEYRSLNGEFGLIDFHASEIKSESGEVYGHVLVLRDVTEEEELLKEIEFQARHDDLTGIYNRWEFENRFNALVSATRDESSAHILMYMDLDQFKLVNDTCGHHAGDELLRRLTAAFGACLDNDAILARLGGDEFGVILENCGVDIGLDVARALRDTAQNFIFTWDDKSFDVGVSIGVVPITFPVESVHTLMGFADVACYLAKEHGRNNIRLHREEDQELAKRKAEMNWATRLKASVAADEFSLHYQDIVPVEPTETPSNRKIEILLRLRDENGNYLTPDHFIPSAERYNLMPDLDRWVINEAFRWYQKTGYAKNIIMNINLSGLSFCAPKFLEFVYQKFNQYQVPPGAVCFELTETAAIQNLPEAENFMRSLRALGCRFALDDFGTGLSSFAYLKDLPIDFLKIDGKFIKGISKDRIDRAMVSAINDVGHTMNIKTVAEYVENDSIFAELRKLKVDYAQGYGIGKPKALDTLVVNRSRSIH